MKNEAERTLYINTDTIKQYDEKVYETIKSLGTSSDDVDNNFIGLKKKNIYKNGITKIGKAINRTRDTLYNTYNINEEFINRYIELEEKGKSLVKKIIIPNIFSTNSSSRNTTLGTVNIDKNDGTSVTEGQLVDNSSDNNYKEENILLENIKKDENGKEHDLNGSIIEKEGISNIEKDLDYSVEDEKYVTEKEVIGNINSDDDNNQIKDEQKTNITEQVIGNINNNELENNASVEEVQLDANTQPVIANFNSQLISSEPVQSNDNLNNFVNNNEEVNVDDNQSEM